MKEAGSYNNALTSQPACENIFYIFVLLKDDAHGCSPEHSVSLCQYHTSSVVLSYHTTDLGFLTVACSDSHIFNHVLLMKVMSLFKSVLVDTVAKTRTLLPIMLSFYFIVLHLLFIFLLPLSLCFPRWLPEFLACLLCQ